MASDSISSVNGTNSANGSSTSTALTAATKAKLEALGINTKNITTEAQGQTLLKTAQVKTEAMKKAKDSQKNSSKNSLKTEVKSLASEVGASISDNDTIDGILNKISSKISELRQSAGDDKVKLAEIQQYQSRFEAVSSQYSDRQAAQAQLSGSMNGLANLNKIYQNLS
ncbi:MAG: hypothetical protein WCY19_03515 [Candidatus Gastranaerophilaceae bacterium]